MRAEDQLLPHPLRDLVRAGTERALAAGGRAGFGPWSTQRPSAYWVDRVDRRLDREGDTLTLPAGALLPFNGLLALLPHRALWPRWINLSLAACLGETPIVGVCWSDDLDAASPADVDVHVLGPDIGPTGPVLPRAVVAHDSFWHINHAAFARMGADAAAAQRVITRSLHGWSVEDAVWSEITAPLLLNPARDLPLLQAFAGFAARRIAAERWADLTEDPDPDVRCVAWEALWTFVDDPGCAWIAARAQARSEAAGAERKAVRRLLKRLRRERPPSRSTSG